MKSSILSPRPLFLSQAQVMLCPLKSPQITNGVGSWAIRRVNRTIFRFPLGGKYNEQIVMVLDVDMVTAFTCRDVLSVHSLEGMPSLIKTDTPPHALPPMLLLFAFRDL